MFKKSKFKKTSKFSDIVTWTNIQKADRNCENLVKIVADSKSKDYLDDFCDFNMATSLYKLARNPFCS